MAPRDGLGFIRIVDEHEGCLGGVVAEIGVGIVPDEEMQGAAVMDFSCAFPPVEKFACIVEKLVSLAGIDRKSVCAEPL